MRTIFAMLLAAFAAAAPSAAAAQGFGGIDISGSMWISIVLFVVLFVVGRTLGAFYEVRELAKDYHKLIVDRWVKATTDPDSDEAAEFSTGMHALHKMVLFIGKTPERCGLALAVLVGFPTVYAVFGMAVAYAMFYFMFELDEADIKEAAGETKDESDD